jgi:uncharacterized protein
MLPVISLRKLLALFFAGVLFANSVSAENSERRLCLWEMNENGNRIYLLGSIHAMREDMYPLPGPISSAFENSDVVVFEIDLTRLDSAEMSNVMEHRGTYKSPASIVDDLSEETMGLLTTYLQESNISMAQIRHLKPWNLSLNIGVMELTRLGYKKELGLDQNLQQLAVAQNKEIKELESFSEQIDLLSADPIEIQDLSLRVSLLERHHIRKDLDQMVTAWRTGDADRMYELTVDSIAEYPKLQQQLDRLVSARNAKMVSKIRQYLASGRNHLVVAGALHMGGPDGIINLLASEFSVVQITYPDRALR